MDIGPKRDVVGELRDAFRKHPDLHFGLYYSLFEWFNPMYLRDKANNYTTRCCFTIVRLQITVNLIWCVILRTFVTNKMLPEMKFLATNYQPEIWWSDGDWEAPPEYFGSQEFLAWLYNESPMKDTVVVNDRWGDSTRQKHGGFYSGPDRFDPGHLFSHKFEDAFTVDKVSWAYRRNIELEDILSTDELIATIAEVVSCNGNVLINVGPTKEGTIIPIFQERLTQLGLWLRMNGEAIYHTKPFRYQNDSLAQNPKVWYTSTQENVYAIVLGWPQKDVLFLRDVKATRQSKIKMLAHPSNLKFVQHNDRLEIRFPKFSKIVQGCGKFPCAFANVLKFQYISPRTPTFSETVEFLANG